MRDRTSLAIFVAGSSLSVVLMIAALFWL